jgi:hypothetical protein
LGTITSLDATGFDFTSHHEQVSRRFEITPGQLRNAFVHDVAYARLKGESVRVATLPQWFLDWVFEFIGSVQEPYDHDYVILAGCYLCPSPDGVSPDAGATYELPPP